MVTRPCENSQMGQDSLRWLQKTPDGPICLEMALGVPKCLQMVPDIEIAPDSSRALQMTPDGFRWFQMAPEPPDRSR